MVERGDLRAGDLVFFARDGHIVHVGVMLDASRVLHADGSVRHQVTINALDPDGEDYSARLAQLYAGARRPLPRRNPLMAETPEHPPLPRRARRELDGILQPLGGRTALAAQCFNGEKAAIRLRADEVFTAASLAKIPIAIELMRRIDLGHFTATERFDTADEPRAGGGGVLDDLDPATR